MRRDQIAAFARRPIVIRLALVPVLWLALTFATFWALHHMRDRSAYLPETPRDIIEAYLDETLFKGGWVVPEYGSWLRDFVSGDWGVSRVDASTSRDLMLERLPPTLAIAAAITTVSTGVGLGLGRIAATSPSRQAWVTVGSAMAIAVPPFVGAVALIVLSGGWFDESWLVGASEDVFEPTTLARAIVPVTLLGGVTLAPAALWTSRPHAAHEPVHADTVLRTLAIMMPLAMMATAAIEYTLEYDGLGRFALVAVEFAEPRTVQAGFALFFAIALLCWAVAPRARTIQAARRRQSISAQWPLMLGAGLLVVFVLASLIGPVINTNDANAFFSGSEREGPSWDHPFGTTRYGQDIQARVFDAGQTALRLLALVAALGFVPGAAVGWLLAKRGLRLTAAVAHDGMWLVAIGSIPILASISAAEPNDVLPFAIGAIVTGSVVGLLAAQIAGPRAGLERPALPFIASVACAYAGGVLLVDSTLAFVGMYYGVDPLTWSFDFERNLGSDSRWWPAIAIWLTAAGFFLCAFSLREMACAPADATAPSPATERSPAPSSPPPRAARPARTPPHAS